MRFNKYCNKRTVLLQKEFGNENNETMKNYGLFYLVGFSLAVEFEWEPSDGNKNLTKLFLDSDGFYVGGLNTTYFINYNFKGKTLKSLGEIPWNSMISAFRVPSAASGTGPCDIDRV